MRPIDYRTVVAILCLALLSGCAPTQSIFDISQIDPGEAARIELQRAESMTMTSAQLVQMTIRSKPITKRFNVELYHRNDTTSLFTGGFLGKGSFKGILDRFGLKLLFPGEKQYFDGELRGMTDPDLSQYEYVLRRVRAILAGDLLCGGSDAAYGDDCSRWQREVRIRKNHIKKVIFWSLNDPIEIEVQPFKFKDEFPYFQLKQLKVVNTETGMNIKLKFIEQKYGDVPDVKFHLPSTDGWERIDYFELK